MVQFYFKQNISKKKKVLLGSDFHVLYLKAAKHVHDQCIPGKQHDPLLCVCDVMELGACDAWFLYCAGLSVRIMAIMLPLRLLKTSFRMRFDMHPCVCVCRHFEGQNHWGEGHVTVRACLPQHKQIL